MNVLTVLGCCCFKKNNTLKKILLLNILLFSSSLAYSQFDGISKVGHKAIDLTRSPVFKKNKQVENRHIHSSKRNKNTIKKWVKPYYSLSQEPQVAQNNQQAQQSIFPTLRYTGRSELDPLGTLRTNETTLIESKFSQRGISRWGDYSAMTIDPVDDCTFWYTASYVGSDDKTPLSASTWSTRVASFQFPECGGQLNTPIHNFDGIDLFQPRVGFNWVVDDSLEVRAGFGLYSGGNPNVWLSNSYSNDGIVQIGLQYRTAENVLKHR